jgi:hypothetical protein
MTRLLALVAFGFTLLLVYALPAWAPPITGPLQGGSTAETATAAQPAASPTNYILPVVLVAIAVAAVIVILVLKKKKT